uniref:MYND-type domain-containing protein n=1 Tax=Tetradesmus obliquus TaxID=3088 RepID=A0A383VP59_TETOB|eukprot:jgi/Sobl393_1/11819/SZX67308.1
MLTLIKVAQLHRISDHSAVTAAVRLVYQIAKWECPPLPASSSSSSSGTPAASPASTALASSLAGPVLLQLAPAVLPHIRQLEAAAAAAAAAGGRLRGDAWPDMVSSYRSLMSLVLTGADKSWIAAAYCQDRSAFWAALEAFVRLTAVTAVGSSISSSEAQLSAMASVVEAANVAVLADPVSSSSSSNSSTSQAAVACSSARTSFMLSCLKRLASSFSSSSSSGGGSSGGGGSDSAGGSAAAAGSSSQQAPALDVLDLIWRLLSLRPEVLAVNKALIAADFAHRPFEEVDREFRTAALMESHASRDTADAAAATAGHAYTASLLLVAGRGLFVAGRGLVQLHEQPDSGTDASTVMQLCRVCAVLTRLFACVLAVGLVIEQVAGSAASGSDTALHVDQNLAQVQELQQQLLRDLLESLADVVATGAELAGSCSSIEAQLKATFPAEAARKMVQLGTAIATQLAAPESAALCCANPGCSNCSKLSEQEIVSGKGTVCSSCCAVRLCSAECNKAYWKVGHKQACSRLKERLQQAGSRAQGSSGRGGASSSSSNAPRASSSSSSAGRSRRSRSSR